MFKIDYVHIVSIMDEFFIILYFEIFCQNILNI